MTTSTKFTLNEKLFKVDQLFAAISLCSLNGFSVAVPVYFLSFFFWPSHSPVRLYYTHGDDAPPRYIHSARIDQWIWLGNQLEFARDKWRFCAFIFAQLLMEDSASVCEKEILEMIYGWMWAVSEASIHQTKWERNTFWSFRERMRSFTILRSESM